MNVSRLYLSACWKSIKCQGIICIYYRFEYKKYVFGCYPTKRHLGTNLPIFTVYQKPYT